MPNELSRNVALKGVDAGKSGLASLAAAIGPVKSAAELTRRETTAWTSAMQTKAGA
jgi:hypothetical protein